MTYGLDIKGVYDSTMFVLDTGKLPAITTTIPIDSVSEGITILFVVFIPNTVRSTVNRELRPTYTIGTDSVTLIVPDNVPEGDYTYIVIGDSSIKVSS